MHNLCGVKVNDPLGVGIRTNLFSTGGGIN